MSYIAKLKFVTGDTTLTTMIFIDFLLPLEAVRGAIIFSIV